MLNLPASPPSATPEDRERRVRALVDQLRPAADRALRRMAEALVDAPDRELFGAVEHHLRDSAHDLAAAAHQAGLEGRKKGATEVAASPAPAAANRPSSSTTCPAPC